jgi:hypothetical protein
LDLLEEPKEIEKSKQQINFVIRQEDTESQKKRTTMTSLNGAPSASPAPDRGMNIRGSASSKSVRRSGLVMLTECDENELDGAELSSSCSEAGSDEGGDGTCTQETASNSNTNASSDQKKQQLKGNKIGLNRKQGHRSSLELRKLPENILLKPSSDADDSLSSGVDDDDDPFLQNSQETAKGEIGGLSVFSILQKTCLNSKFSLRMQMMLSFGTVSALTLIIVVAVSLAASITAGTQVNDMTQETFQDLAKSIAGTTAHYLADDLTPRLLPVDLVQILYEATRDRFSGYPLFEDDSQVPFVNLLNTNNNQAEEEDIIMFGNNTNATNTRALNYYPIRGRPLPLDWQMPRDDPSQLVTSSNYYEHVQDRWRWYDHSPTLSTASAAYYMQGMCDPAETNPRAPTYFPNCTAANNDIATGGIIAPTPTNEAVHRKASDLSPLLKSLYEYHQDVKNIGIYLMNGGSGATVVFPHYELNSSNSYTSAGCNWMLNDHPLERPRSLATLQDFERCEGALQHNINGLNYKRIHRSKNQIPSRLYNPMDRDWCIEQALNPHKIHVVGPYKSAWYDRWQMSLGRSVYDRVTNEFVACISIDFVLDRVEDILRSSKVTNSSEVTVVRHDQEGTVVASTDWNRKAANDTVKIHQLNVGVTQASYTKLHELVDFSKHPWDPEQVIETYENFLLQTNDSDYLVSAFPLPPPPDTFDTTYEPEFLVVVSIAEDEFFRRANYLSDTVDEKVVDLEVLILTVGCIGLGMMIAIIFMVANTLTAPLKYMNKVASDIVSNFGDTRQATSADEDVSANTDNKIMGQQQEQARHDTATATKTKKKNVYIEIDRKNLESRCAPRTELEDIVKEFERMVRNFSGTAMAKAAHERVTEIENRFELLEDFHDLYNLREKDPKFKFRWYNNSLAARSANDNNDLDAGEERPLNRANFGHNIIREVFSKAGSRGSDFLKETRNNEGRMTSPLFFWIVVLIVTPLLVTTITISCVLMVNIAQQFPDFVEEVKQEFIQEEIFALKTYVDLRANLTAVTTERSTRDLHVLTRYAGWVLFGGVDRNPETFVEMRTGAEECKVFQDLKQCPYVQEKICDCAWKDVRGNCQNYSLDTRQWQEAFFVAESHDTDAEGDRNTTSFPDVCYSQETTAWWHDATTVPGFEKGASASEYQTTFDRLASSSALPIWQLLYNYDVTKSKTVLGGFIAFEDDGLFAGYGGCAFPGDPGYAQWFSNVGNGAAELRPELCPLGMTLEISTSRKFDASVQFWL